MGIVADRRTFLAGLGAACLSPVTASSQFLAQDDLTRLDAWLTALHPGLYRYQTQADYRRRLHGLRTSWRTAPSLEQRFLALSRFTAAIRCGHTFCNPNNQSDAVAARLFESRRLVPLRFRWIGQQMIVVEDAWTRGIDRGTEVLSIDGVSASRIQSTLLNCTRADGHNSAKQRSLLSVEGHDRFETFDIFHPLLFPGSGPFRLSLRDTKGRKRYVSLDPIDRAQRLAVHRKSPDRSATDPWWTFERKGRAAVLTMPDWAIYDTKWEWKSWLEQRFTELAASDAKGLVIDLRGNEGGIDIGDHIIAHLVREPLAPFAYRRRTRFQSVPDGLRTGLNTWDKDFFTLGMKGQPVDGGYFELPGAKEGPTSMLQPKAPFFGGKVAVLIDSANSSATNQFAARVQEKRLATLVGRETGGNQRGINGGAFFFATLPESGLEFDLPLIGTFPPTPKPDRGIVPEVAVPLTGSAIASGRDEAMQRALEIVLT